MIATIQQFTKEPNGAGGFFTTWADISIVEGTLDMLSGDTTSMANQQTVNSTHIFICKPIAIITDNRLIIDGAIYTIKYIDNPMNMDFMYEIYLEYKELLQ